MRGGKMYNVSEEYLDAMNHPIRNRSYMRIIIGLINLEAQMSAYISSQENYTQYSDLINIFTQMEIGNQYATYEKDFFRSDGSMYFLPRNASNISKNGLITNNIFDNPTNIEIIIGYGNSDIRGITIQFGECYPTKFSIILSTGEEFFYENTSSLFETEDIFLNTNSITIKITEMSISDNRVRIYGIKFGLGIEFNNEWIIDVKSNSSLSAIDESLPEVSTTINLKNDSQRFNVDNPDSEINFLESEQSVSVMYGYELDNGEIEWFQLNSLKVSNWSADDTQASITSVDRFKYMTDNYYKGQYYEDGISLYDLAILVLSDAQIESSEYYIDTYLKNVIVHNPLPNVSHKEALQIIANAGRCILDIDRYGRIRMYSSFIPDYEVSSNGEEYYSDVSKLNDPISKNHYASYAQDYWVSDGSLMFVPRSGKQLTGYSSQEISGDDGVFEKNPIVILNLEAKFKCFGLKILFFGNLPSEFIIRTYADEILNETININSNIKLNYDLFYEFEEFNKMEIEFVKTQIPHNRIQIDYIEFGPETNYTIGYDDLYSTPVGTQLDLVKNLNVSRYIYTNSNTSEELINEEIVYDNQNQIYYFSEPCYGYLASVTEGNAIVTIVSSGAYFVELSFSNTDSGSHIKISVSGYKYNISENIYTINVNNRGINTPWQNPLISDIKHCKDVSEWLADYYTSRIEYSLNYRGDPSLECGDTIYQENKYVDNLKVIIEEHEISFNGTIEGALRTRRKERVDRS